MELEERVAALEPETLALRRYVRAIISLLPQDQQVNGVLADTVRTLNLDARALAAEQGGHLEKANAAIGALSIPRLGLLLAKTRA